MIRTILAIAIFFTLSIQVTGQSRLRFDRISIDKGLSHTRVHTIFQDNIGLIWIGTEEGLNIYNGYSFDIYKHDASQANSLSNNVIKTIFQDSKGTIWIGTEYGLNRYIPENNHFQVFLKKEHDKNGLTDNHIRRIIEDKKGNLWLGTDNGVTKITSYSDTSITCVQYPYEPDNPQALANPKVRGLFIDSKERIWIGTDGGGLYKVINNSSATTGNSEKFIHYIHQEDNSNTIGSDRINGFSEDPYGNIWVSTWRGGVNKIYIDKNGDERIIRYKFHPTKNSINLDKVTTLFTDNKGFLWVGTYNAGINRAKIQQNTDELVFESYIHESNNSLSISHNSAYVFFEDKAGEIWIGTWGDGISKANPHNNKMLLWGEINGFPDPAFHEIWSVDFDDQNNWWVGAWDGGIAKIANDNPSNYYSYDKNITYFKHDSNNPNSISGNKITSILHDSKDRLWATTWSEDLNVAFNVSSSPTPQFKKIKVGDNGYFVFEDQDGGIWTGSQNGLYKIHDTDKSMFSTDVVNISIYKNEAQNKRSLPDSKIRTMFEDNEGNFWIGTSNGGLAVAKKSTFQEFADPADMVFDLYAHQDGDTNTLSNNHIYTIFQSKNGTIWVGTQGGLNRYDKDHNAFSYYNEASGHLINDAVSGILEDSKGNLWLSTDRGITKFNPKTEETIHYDERDGLQGKVFAPASIKQDQLGNFFFGGVNGLNVFNPDDIQLNPFIPNVILTDLKILNKSIKNTDHPSLNGIAFNELRSISIKKHENMLTFEFASLNFTVSENNQYQFKLEGFDKNWHYVNHKRTATYTNLDAGTYTFLVRGSNNDGVWNKTPLEIKVIVLPPFWETWWFRTLVIGIIVFVSVCYFLQRIKNVEKRAEALEIEVEERTKEIKKQKQLVEERSQYKEQFFSKVSHELRTPLNGIMGLSYLMERTKLSGIQSQFTSVIKDSAENLLVIINDLLDISKLNAGKIEIVARPFETSRFFNSLYELLNIKAEQKNLELSFVLDKDLPAYLTGDSVRLYQILINLLGNALKFTAEGHVSLIVQVSALEEKNIEVQFEIIDSGIGIPADKINSIFNTYEQVIDDSGYHYEGSGLGLSIVKNLVDLQNGTIKVESRSNNGTMFTVVLPFVIATEEAINKELQAKEKESFSKKWRDKEVLLIEDNQVNLLYAKNLFIQWNLSVTIAKSISQAIQLLAISKYDVIISDVKLPDGNGIDLIRKLQKDHRHVNRHTPVIVLSAIASLSGAKPDDINVEAYLSKPFKPARLSEELSKIFKESIGLPSSTGDQDTGLDNDNYLDHLYQLMKGNTKHVKTMVEIFLKQLPEAIENLDMAIINENWESTNYISHTIKSTIQTIGLTDLANLARDIETSSEVDRPNLIHILNLFEDFKQKSAEEVPRLKEEVEKITLNS